MEVDQRVSLVLEELIEEIDGARFVGSDDALRRGPPRVRRRSSLWSAVLIPESECTSSKARNKYDA